MKISVSLRCSLLAFATVACVAPGRVLQHLPSAVNAHRRPPLGFYQTTLTARVQIRDLQGKGLGEYEGRRQAKVQVAI